MQQHSDLNMRGFLSGLKIPAEQLTKLQTGNSWRQSAEVHDVQAQLAALTNAYRAASQEQQQQQAAEPGPSAQPAPAQEQQQEPPAQQLPQESLQASAGTEQRNMNAACAAIDHITAALAGDSPSKSARDNEISPLLLTEKPGQQSQPAPPARASAGAAQRHGGGPTAGNLPAAENSLVMPITADLLGPTAAAGEATSPEGRPNGGRAKNSLQRGDAEKQPSDVRQLPMTQPIPYGGTSPIDAGKIKRVGIAVEVEPSEGGQIPGKEAAAGLEEGETMDSPKRALAAARADGEAAQGLDGQGRMRGVGWLAGPLNAINKRIFKRGTPQAGGADTEQVTPEGVAVSQSRPGSMLMRRDLQSSAVAPIAPFSAPPAAPVGRGVLALEDAIRPTSKELLAPTQPKSRQEDSAAEGEDEAEAMEVDEGIEAEVVTVSLAGVGKQQGAPAAEEEEEEDASPAEGAGEALDPHALAPTQALFAAQTQQDIEQEEEDEDDEEEEDSKEEQGGPSSRMRIGSKIEQQPIPRDQHLATSIDARMDVGGGDGMESPIAGGGGGEVAASPIRRQLPFHQPSSVEAILQEEEVGEEAAGADAGGRAGTAAVAPKNHGGGAAGLAGGVDGVPAFADNLLAQRASSSVAQNGGIWYSTGAGLGGLPPTAPPGPTGGSASQAIALTAARTAYAGRVGPFTQEEYYPTQYDPYAVPSQEEGTATGTPAQDALAGLNSLRQAIGMPSAMPPPFQSSGVLPSPGRFVAPNNAAGTGAGADGGDGLSLRGKVVGCGDLPAQAGARRRRGDGVSGPEERFFDTDEDGKEVGAGFGHQRASPQPADPSRGPGNATLRGRTLSRGADGALTEEQTTEVIDYGEAEGDEFGVQTSPVKMHQPKRNTATGGQQEALQAPKYSLLGENGRFLTMHERMRRTANQSPPEELVESPLSAHDGDEAKMGARLTRGRKRAPRAPQQVGQKRRLPALANQTKAGLGNLPPAADAAASEPPAAAAAAPLPPPVGAPQAPPTAQPPQISAKTLAARQKLQRLMAERRGQISTPRTTDGAGGGGGRRPPAVPAGGAGVPPPRSVLPSARRAPLGASYNSTPAAPPPSNAPSYPGSSYGLPPPPRHQQQMQYHPYNKQHQDMYYQQPCPTPSTVMFSVAGHPLHQQQQQQHMSGGRAAQGHRSGPPPPLPMPQTQPEAPMLHLNVPGQQMAYVMMHGGGQIPLQVPAAAVGQQQWAPMHVPVLPSPMAQQQWRQSGGKSSGFQSELLDLLGLGK